MTQAETSSVQPLQVLYLDFDGVLHPDSAYRTRSGIELLHHPGHSLFEHVPLLDEMLAPYPDVKIVLSTSWLLIKGGYDHAEARLSPTLQERCIGGTFHRREMRKAWFQSKSRPEQVLLDVHRRNPVAWVAVDDCPEGWPDWTSDHVVRTNSIFGIAASAVLQELKTKLQREFGE
nr:HAD domain-containing protein [uncultured Cupriavidus sp.]